MSFCRGGSACRHSAPPKSRALLYAHFIVDIVVVKNSTASSGNPTGRRDDPYGPPVCPADFWICRLLALKKGLHFLKARLSPLLENAPRLAV